MAPAGIRIRTTGLGEFIRATDAAGRETKTFVRSGLRTAAEPVKEDAVQRLAKYDQGSAAGLRIVVRKTGRISIEQSIRKVTGKRPDYGALQMRLLYEAYDAKFEEYVTRLDEQFNMIVDELIQRG